MHLGINRKRKRIKKVSIPENRGQIKNMVSIEERFKVVDTRTSFGDWEADLVSGARHKGFLVILFERKKVFVKINYV